MTVSGSTACTQTRSATSSQAPSLNRGVPGLASAEPDTGAAGFIGLDWHSCGLSANTGNPGPDDPVMDC